MPWYDYALCFLGGTFIANFVPHFVRGITGTQFPTPFASPPGRGMSSPALNVLWALVNLIAGFLLLQAGAFSFAIWQLLVTAFAGFALMALMLSRVFDLKAEESRPARQISSTRPDDMAPQRVVAPSRPADQPAPRQVSPARPDDKPPPRDLRSGL